MKKILTVLFFIGAITVHAQQKITNSIGMEFILIQPGSMTVGEFQPPYPKPEDTVKRAAHPYIMAMGEGRGYSAEEFELARELAKRDSKNGFEVTIKNAYYIGKFEVTQGQWKKVMGDNPSQFQNATNADSLPVENVSWEDAQKFLRQLNKLENKKCYRLPTEFEWEFAARAGDAKDISWDRIRSMANLGKKSTLVVGGRQPNAWGLFDMLGNVWEWVEDYYNEKIFADPEPPKKGSEHVLKGASFAGDVKNATWMTHAAGPGNGWDVGFRVVMVIEKN